MSFLKLVGLLPGGSVICLLPVILVWKIMGKYLKAVTNVKPVIFLQTTQISKTCYSLLKTCYSLS